jgi:hypothetical protein
MHPQNTPRTTLTCTSYPTQSAYVEPKRGRVSAPAQRSQRGGAGPRGNKVCNFRREHAVGSDEGARHAISSPTYGTQVPVLQENRPFCMALDQRSGIDSGIMTLSIPDRCPCAIRSRPFEMLYGLFFRTQGHESRRRSNPSRIQLNGVRCSPRHPPRFTSLMNDLA